MMILSLLHNILSIEEGMVTVGALVLTEDARVMGKSNR